MRHAGETVPPWTCPTCAQTVTTPYCASCGESPVRADDLTVRGVSYQLFHAVSSIDGRVVRSLRRLLTRPGALTVAYVNGPRKLYIGPFQLFLLANLVFVALQSMTGMGVFSSTLDSHLHHQDWSPLADRLVPGRLAATHRTLEDYAPVFNRAVVLHAKLLIVLMVIPFSLLLPVVFYGTKRPFGLHVVFAVHVYAFLLFVFCAALLVAAVSVVRGGAGLESAGMDDALSALNLAACAVYLYLACGVVYGAKGALRVVQALALSIAVAGIVLGYRFALFLLTLYVT